MTILAIDPGPERSAYVEFDGDHLHSMGIAPNDQLLASCRLLPIDSDQYDAVVIERVEGFGMAVGAEVFETVYWSGRFAEAADPLPVHRIGRKAITVALCGTTKAKDSNIRTALIDRFGGPSAIRKGGPLFGVSKDVWSALAVAVVYSDMEKEAT